MIEWMDQLDKSLMVFLNGLNHPFMDSVMAFITNKKTWFPVYALLAVYLLIRYKWRGFYFIAIIGITVGIADFVTSGLFKPGFERLRPCHQEGFRELIHMVTGCGGKYGFASGHSANSFAMAVVIYLTLFRDSQYGWLLFVWAFIVAYSRVYVGVHFPGDILVGGILGTGIGWLVYKLWSALNSRYLLIR